MATYREAKTTFERIIKTQDTALQKINAERAEIETAYSELNIELTSQIGQIVGDLSPEMLETLDQISKASNVYTISEMMKTLEEENAAEQQKRDEYEAEHGSLDWFRASLASVTAEADNILARIENTDEESIHNDIDELTSKTQPITNFNTRGRKIQITRENIEELADTPIPDLLKSLSIRRMRASWLANAYEGDYGKDLDILTIRENAIAAITEGRETASALQADAKTYAAHITELERLDSAISSPEDIRRMMIDAIAEYALEMPEYAEALSKTITDPELSTNFATTVTCMMALDQADDNLEDQASMLSSAKGKITPHMSKLRTAASRAGSRQAKFDPQDIEQKMMAPVIRSGYATTEAGRVRRGAQSFGREQASTDLFTTQNILLLYLLSDMSVDPAYAKDVLTLDAETASDLGLDFENITPDFALESGAIAEFAGLDIENLGLGASFDDAVNKLGDLGIDMGSVSVDVPSIDVNIPDTTSSYGGGYDSGSSFDSSF